MKSSVYIMAAAFGMAAAFCFSSCREQQEFDDFAEHIPEEFERAHEGEREHRRLISDNDEWVIADEQPPINPEDVILEVPDISDDVESIVYTVTNISDRDLRHGDNIALYHNDNGQWREIELPDDASWNRLGDSVGAGSRDDGEINLHSTFSELPEGLYRLEKNFYDGANAVNPTAEFRIAYNK
ncbi:MAG: hypothetical protein FWH05_08395 [Oscillospiraceae bacterium]|nr:hypothetical protein [Oscillospiraceae bacterium]